MANRDPMQNWGRNVRYSAREIVRARSVDDVVAAVKGNEKVRALGTRHTFNRVADTDGAFIDLRLLNRIEGSGGDRVQAGCQYGEIGLALERRGRNLENYPSLPHVCVGGAVQTGTHGSGTQNLAAQVLGMELVTADGELRTIQHEWEDDALQGAVVSLGAIGIVTALQLELKRKFSVVQEVYENVPADVIAATYPELIASAYSVSLFTRWMSETIDQVWVKRREDRDWQVPDALLCGEKSRRKLHPIREVNPEFCTEQGMPGPAHERLPHFKLEFEPSSAGAELQSEYFVARSDLPAVMAAMGEIGPRLQECLMISEVRSVDRDSLWLSPCYGRDSVAIHFTWRPMEAEVVRLLREVVEPALRPFAPRPHWGKLFTLAPAEVMSQYPKLPEFRALCDHWDPAGKFRNDFTNRYVFGL